MRVIRHPLGIVIEAQVHRRRVGRVVPEREGGGVSGGTRHVQPDRRALPEIMHRKRHATAGRAADIAEAGGATGGIDVDPAVAGAGAFGDGEAVRVWLAQAELAPRGDVLCFIAHGRRGGGERRGSLARHLRLAERGAGVAPQASERTHRLAPQATLLSGKADVPVVQRVAERHLPLQPEAADEQLGRVDIENQAVDDPHRGGAGVEVQPHGEGQPLAAAATMRAVELHHRAHRAALLDRGGGDSAGRVGERGRCVGVVVRTVLRAGDEPHRPHHLAPADLRRTHHRLAALADQPAHAADRDLDRVDGFAHRYAVAGPARGAGHNPEPLHHATPGRERMAGPFDRAVRPPRHRPALQRLMVTALARQCVATAAIAGAARPWLPPALAFVCGRQGVIQPRHIGAIRPACRHGKRAGRKHRDATDRSGARQEIAASPAGTRHQSSPPRGRGDA